MVKRKIGVSLIVCTLAVILQLAECYSGGAPIDACGVMTPRHGLSQRSAQRSPYVILLSKDNFEPNETIMVMLRGLCKNKFRGFLVEARRADPRFNQTERMGTFTAVQQSRYECGRESALTHITNDDKSSLLFNWTAPAQPVGDIIITATVVQRFSTFWIGVNSAVVKDNGAERAGFRLSIDPSTLLTQYITPCPEDLPGATTQPPPTTTTVTTTTTTATTTTTLRTTPRITRPTPTTRTTPSTVPRTTPWTTTTGRVLPTPRDTTTPFVIKSTPHMDTGKKCGVTRGCFNQCKNGACDFNVQWRDMGDRVWFSIGARILPGVEDQWLAMGLSHDRKMGDDSVVECVSRNNRRSLSLSYNQHRANRRMLSSEPVIFPISDTLSHGYLICEFARIKKLDTNDRIFDLGHQWYIFLAQGPVIEGRMEQHTNMPWVSKYRANFQSSAQVDMHTGTKLFIKIHACAMTFAWMFCASIAIVMARFYKPLWPQSRYCGRKLWFTVHRLMMMFMSLLVVGAFVVIFLEVRGLSEISFVDFRKIHPVLGMIVTGLTVIQVIMGLARPGSTSKSRPVFNWAHWCVGILDHILAVVNIILGVGLKKAGLHDYVSYIIYCFGVYQVFIVFILEVVACNSRIKERKQQTYSIYADRATKYSSAKETDDDTEPPGSFTRRVILRIHVLMVTAFTGGVIAIIAIS